MIVRPRDIDPARPYHANILYDIVMAVRSMNDPNYKDVQAKTGYPTETVVNFLRYA